MDRDDVGRWVEAYEQAWRSPGTGGLAKLFTQAAIYHVSPWATPVEGLEAISDFWEAERDGPDEDFTMDSEVVAVDGNTAVVRAQVEYGGPDPARWRDLWVLQFDDDGRCRAFEEWPFAPEQRDGHG